MSGNMWSEGTTRAWTLAGVLLTAVAIAVTLVVAQESSARVANRLEKDPYRHHTVGELIVTYEPGASSVDEADARAAVGGRLAGDLPRMNTELLSLPEVTEESVPAAGDEILQRRKLRLERNPDVRSVDYNYVGRTSASFVPNDPRFGDQWALNRVRAPEAWGVSRGGKMDIAILDSGIYASHPDFENKIVARKNFVTRDRRARDDTGHGTKVAGIAAAKTNNGKGIAGMCPGCRLIVGKVANGGSVTAFDIVDGINWATNNGAEVINISLAISSADPDTNTINSLCKAAGYAADRGTIVVAASGNSGTANASVYPAACGASVVAVGGTTQTPEQRSYDSGYGDWLDVVAPGEDVLSTQKGGGYAYDSGTSFAAPHVAGLAALLKKQGLSYDCVHRRIENTSVDLGATGEDAHYGHGRIDAADAVAAGGC